MKLFQTIFIRPNTHLLYITCAFRLVFTHTHTHVFGVYSYLPNEAARKYAQTKRAQCRPVVNTARVLRKSYNYRVFVVYTAV